MVAVVGVGTDGGVGVEQLSCTDDHTVAVHDFIAGGAAQVPGAHLQLAATVVVLVALACTHIGGAADSG